MKKSIVILSSLGVLAISGCQEDKEGQKSAMAAQAGGQIQDSFLSFDVKIEQSDDAALNLNMAATEYTVTLDSCASGYATSITTGQTLTAYLNDKNCKVKLTSLTIGSVVYSPTNAAPAVNFSTFAAGETAVFTDGAVQPKVLNITLASTLNPAGVSASDSIALSFTEVNKGSSAVLNNGMITTAGTVSALGDKSPQFDIASIALVNFTNAGVPQLDFKFECSDAADAVITGDLDCSGHVIDGGNLQYAMIADTYGVNAGGVMTAAQLDAIAASGMTAVQTSQIRVGDIGGGVPQDSSIGSKGGFVIPSLNGPGQLSAGSNNLMVLILQVEGVSYKYFGIKIQRTGEL